MLLLISINAIVIAVELISWTRYLNGIELRKKTDEYLNSEQFQKDKSQRLEETYMMIDRIKGQKDAEMITKNNIGKKAKPTPKGRNMIDKL